MSRSDVVKRRYHGFSYWYRKSSSMSSRTSGSPPSKLATITDDRARLSRTAFTSSVGMSFQRFLTCQQLQNEHVKLQRRVSLKEERNGKICSFAFFFRRMGPATSGNRFFWSMLIGLHSHHTPTGHKSFTQPPEDA